MAHQHLQVEDVDAAADVRRREAVAQDVRREVRQLQPALPVLQHRRDVPALAGYADQRGVWLLPGDEASDRRATVHGHGLLPVVGLAVHAEGRSVRALAVVADLEAAHLGEPDAGREQQQHHIGGVLGRGRVRPRGDAVHDREHVGLLEEVEPRLAHLARRSQTDSRVDVQALLGDREAEQAADDAVLLAPQRPHADLALADLEVVPQGRVRDGVQRRLGAPLDREPAGVLLVVVHGVRARAGLAQVGLQELDRALDGQDGLGQAGRLLERLVLVAVGDGFLDGAVGRAVSTAAVASETGAEARSVAADVGWESGFLGWHGRGRVPSAGASVYEFEGKTMVSRPSMQDDCGERESRRRAATLSFLSHVARAQLTARIELAVAESAEVTEALKALFAGSQGALGAKVGGQR